jgi:hypothetical protein
MSKSDWMPPYTPPAGQGEKTPYYDFKRDWPESAKHDWTGVVGRIWYNHEKKVLRITFSGEWPDTVMVPGAKDGVMVTYGLVNGRTMQIDIHGVDWND